MADGEGLEAGATESTLRFGHQQHDGSVRFIVSPIQWGWVLGMAACCIAFSAYLILSASGPWYATAIFWVLPFGITWREGFDVRADKGEIYGWKALGPIRYSTFTLRHLHEPEVRSAMETHTSSEGHESTSRVTRLWWGSRNLHVRMERSELKALLKEAGTVGLTAKKGRAKSGAR